MATSDSFLGLIEKIPGFFKNLIFSFFIALTTEKGTNLLNGDSKIEYSGIFKAAGTEIQYSRRRIISFRDVGESIFIKGPIQEPIVLKVRQ